MADSSAWLGALRRRAEEALARGEVLHDRATATLANNLPALVENLRIQQAELELQNDELREAQEQARVSLRQYTTLFEELPVAAVVIAPTGVIEQHNREAVALFGEQLERPQSLLRLVDEATATNRLVITALLKKLGCTVALAENGEQAVVMLRDGARPDVVLMDLHMPVLDGFGATAAIRAWERERDAAPVPIVALTADAFERDRQHCLAAGMNGFLTKPVVVDELRAELARWERRGGVRPESQ